MEIWFIINNCNHPSYLEINKLVSVRKNITKQAVTIVSAG